MDTRLPTALKRPAPISQGAVQPAADFAHLDSSLRHLAGRPIGDARAHPDQAPLTAHSQSAQLGQDAPRFPIPELIRNVISVLAILAMIFGVLMIPGGVS